MLNGWSRNLPSFRRIVFRWLRCGKFSEREFPCVVSPMPQNSEILRFLRFRPQFSKLVLHAVARSTGCIVHRQTASVQSYFDAVSFWGRHLIFNDSNQMSVNQTGTGNRTLMRKTFSNFEWSLYYWTTKCPFDPPRKRLHNAYNSK